MKTLSSGFCFSCNKLSLLGILRRSRFAILVSFFLLNWQSVTAQDVPGQVNVTQYHYDLTGTGQNLNEATLSPASVNPVNFGKLFSYPVDGFVYAQPLFLTGVFVAGFGARNVVYVATQGDSVYAFDADNPDPATGGGLLWQRTFTNPAAGVTTIPTIEVYPNPNFPDIRPQIGITGTPVIQYDPTTGTGTLFVIVKTKEIRGADIHYVQRLQALNVGSGADALLPGGQLIADTIFNGPGTPYVHDPANPCVPGTGDGSQAGQVCFNAMRELNRPALVLRNGVVWTAYASHGDNGPYHGWVLGYSATDLSLVATFNTTPNGGLGGIWEGAAAPVFDTAGNIYVVTGNGTFRTDPDGTKNLGETVLKLASTPDKNGILPVLSSFTPFEQAALNQGDVDQGSGGILLLPDQAGAHPHLLVQTGKRGKVYLLDRESLGAYRHGVGCDQEPVLETCDNAVQFTPNGTVGGGSYGTSAYFNTGSDQFVFYGGNGDTIKAFQFNPSTGKLDLPPASQSSQNFGFTGVTPTISAFGHNNAILWGLDVNGFGLPQKPTSSPMILHAYDATDLSKELYSSAQVGARDRMGDGVKFNTPTVANAHVYVGTQISLEVFGLFAEAFTLPPAPSSLMAMPGPPFPAPPSIILNWTNNAPNATGVEIERSLNGKDFTLFTTVGRNQTTYTDNAVESSVKYYYRLRAVNQLGESEDPSNIASATTHIGGPALQVSDVFDSQVSLMWNSAAPSDGHYTVARSLDGVIFTTIATVPGTTTQFTDAVSSFGTYFYQVTAFNADGSDSAVSNIASATVGPENIDHSGGFANHADLTANANTSRSLFMGNVLRLTDGQNGEAGTAFTSTQVGIRKFTTSFTFQARPGTVPMADGLTFIIQSNSAMALGNSGGGMGYSGIQRSVAIKFDLFNHGHGGYSTGLYVDGHNPDVPGPGEADINLVGTPIDLTSGHPFKVDLTYDSTSRGGSLVETITDTSTGGSFTIDDYPPLDIPAHVGGDTAFVGFGAGTGGFNAIQDIQSWTFTIDESGLPPRKPSKLAVSKIEEPTSGHFNVTLGWKGSNAFTATGYKLERDDGTGFMQIAQLPVNQTSYTDTNLAAGGHFYRVRSFNASQNSDFSSAICVPLASGGAIDHSTGFSCHGDLNNNGSASFFGSPAVVRLTDGGGGEAGSVFTLNKVNVAKFTTSFKFLLTNPNADGMCWVVQGNSPSALGPAGGGLGYGPDTRGGPRGIRNSLCVKFDLFDNQGEGINSTGLFGDGRSPTLPERDSGDILVDLTGTFINLHIQHVFQVDLTYDGTMLTEKITDTTDPDPSHVFSTSYTINIPAAVGGSTAFMGFTGGTGGLTAIQDVQTWIYNPTP